MKFSLKTGILAVVLTFVYAINSNAQLENNRYKVDVNPQDLATCGGVNNSLEEVTILGKNANCHDFSITFDLPLGIEYVSGTATITAQSGSGDYVISEGGTSSDPIFTILRPNDENWQVNDVVTFTFERSANCDAVEFSGSGGIFKDAYTINFQDAGGANSDSESDPPSYDLMAASLNISSIPTINANVGQTYVRDIVIAQGGNGCTESFTYYVNVGEDVRDVYSLSYNGEPLGTMVDGVYTVTIDLNSETFEDVGNKNSCFENGETIVLQEEFRVDDCLDTAVVHNAYWGCSPGETCQAASPQTGSLNFGTSVPAIALTKVGSTTPDLCNAVTYTVKIENTKTTEGSMALDVGINLGMGHNTSAVTTAYTNPLWDFDYYNTRKVSNFRFGTNASFNPGTKPSTSYPGRGSGNTISIPPDFFTSDPDGPNYGFDDLDSDGFYDDLPPNASTELSFDFEISPRDVCGTGRYDYMGWEHTYFDVYFKDQCKGDRVPERIDLNYFNIIRDYQNVTEIEAPTDITNNEDFTLKIAPSIYAGGSGRPTIDGEAIFSNKASSLWTITIDVPAGMELQASASPDFSQSGSQITYTTTNMSGNTFKEWVEFPLTYTCGTNGMKSISYTTNFTATGSSGVCWSQDIHCGTVNIFTHCPGGCVGPVIEDFTAERITAGWTDETMSTAVVLDENTDGIKKYLAGDQMKVTTKASINNVSLDNLYFDLTYNTASAAAGGAGIITLVDSKITINDTPSTSQSGVLANAPVLTTNGSTEHLLTFDLSDDRSLIGPGYEYEGDATENDVVELELTFEFSKDFQVVDYFELTNFRGEFYAYTDSAHTEANRVGCDTWGDRAYYSRPNIYGSNQTRSGEGCTPSLGYMYFTHNMSPSDMFADEYRPMTIWESTVVDIPEGARFTGNVTSNAFSSNNYSTATGEFVATESNGQVIITPGPNFVNRDQTGLVYQRFEVEFVGTCNSPTEASYDYTINYQDFAYASPVSTSFTNTNKFSYTQPTFIVQSPLPTVNGDAYKVDFDVNISNTSPQDIDYNWLQVTVPVGINITDAFSVSGGVETAVNFYQAGDKTWIEAGAIASGATKSIRFKGDFEDCSDLTVLVEHGWDCLGYPGYPDTHVDVSDFQAVGASCYQNSTSITLEPKNAQVQIGITDQPVSSQDLCTPFHVELDIISAQLADLVNPRLEFAIPGGATGIDIVEAEVEYPKNSGNSETVSVTITDGTATVNLMEHSGIAAISGIAGNPANNSVDDRTVHVDLELQLMCDFISNSPLTFKVYGESPCGDPAFGNGSRVVSDAIEATGAVAPYDALSTINLPGFGAPIQGCGVTETINVETLIAGSNSTGASDYALIELRPGIEYVDASFTGTGTHVATFESVTTVGDHQEIIVKYPAGVAPGESISFDFDFITTNEGICDDTEEIHITNYVTVGTMSCGGTACSEFQVSPGFSYETMPLEKPVLAGTANDSFFTVDTGNNYEYNLSIDIENLSALDAAAGYTYNVYCADVNGEILGAAIATGTVASTVPNSSTIVEEIVFTTAGAACSGNNLIVEFLPSSTNCQCEAIQIEVPVVSGAPLNLDNDNDGIPDVIEVYNGDADGDGVLDYGDPDFCAANFDGVDGWDCATMGLPDPDADLDGDGTPNYYDTDFPACGGLNANGVCINFDTDGDGVPNHLDLDSDNDGITDIVELGEGNKDADGDGVLDNLTDVDNDGLADVVDNDTTDGPEGSVPCTPQIGCVQTNSTSNIFDTDGDGTTDNSGDFDGDGIINAYDLDSDNDGILDTVEAQATSSFNAPGAIDPATGIPVVGTDTDGIDPIDTDGDGNPDYLDLDADNDGVTDTLEAGGADTDGDGAIDGFTDADGNGVADSVDATPLPDGDSDNDGVLDRLDLDSDNDGIPDVTEAGGVDGDGDGIIDTFMTDADNDGLADSVDPVGPATAGMPLENPDTDGDGLDDRLDLDSDNDGIPDVLEAGGTDPDNDGRIGTGAIADDDGDGLSNIVDTDDNTTQGTPGDGGGTALPISDFDGDGLPDYLDIDSDNDGITDTTEAGGTDVDGDGRIDGFDDTTTTDGWDDATAASPLLIPDTDEDGKSDYLDIDADDDGIPDNVEAQTTAGYVAPANAEATNGLDTNYPTGLTPVDTDGDLIPDYLDPDSDNDGVYDVFEAGQGIIMDPLADSDNDGLNDAFDDTPGNDVNNDLDIGALATDNVDDLDPNEVDFRSILDTDGDGIMDTVDIDDDNDGILDVDENSCSYITTSQTLHSNISTLQSANAVVEAGVKYFFDIENVATGGILTGVAQDGVFEGRTINVYLTEPARGGATINGSTAVYYSDFTQNTVDPSSGGIVNNGYYLFYAIVDLNGNGTYEDGVDELLGPVDPLVPTSIPVSTNSGPLYFYYNDGQFDDNLANITYGIKTENCDTDGDGIPDSIDLDSDNDGIPDITEAGGTDTDGDGRVDYPTPGDPTSMVDTNNDGLADEFETNPLPDEDSDNDGVKDRLDLDSDNDGIPDVTEAGGSDADGDGVIDTHATDTDHDGLADSVDPVGPATSGTPLENPDTDGDGRDDRLDTDSDNDGISDVTEAGGSDPDNDGIIGAGPIEDADGDGLSDIVDTDGTGTALPIDDFDGDNVPNHLDLDSDNDGILDVLESGNGALDTNNDGMIDRNDTGFADADNNGQADSSEGTTPVNTDGTGNPDYLDIDADDDGIPDNVEAQPTTGYEAPDNTFDANGIDTKYPNGITPVDTDGDGTPDYLDADSDDDGYSDVVEAGQGSLTGTDTDGDGLDDGFDDTPGHDVNNDLDAGAIDTDNDDDTNTDEVDFRSILDHDQDGITDILDDDDDNDGIADVDESNGTDPSADDDNDGVPNYLDDDPADPAIGDDNGMVEPDFDFDGDGIPNHFDLDSDNDGILDVLESGNGDLDTNNDGMIDSNDTGFADADNNGQADSSEGITPVNTDGTGNPDYLDIDADDDGIPDNVEAQPTTGYVAPADAFDANGVDTNYPNGITPEDTDGDGTPDYLDADSDDDGYSDVVEAGQGSLTGTDSDNDGLDDGFDDTPGNDVNNDLDTGADGTDNEDDADLTEVDFRSVLDHDQDGIPDTVDLDDDNDGIADVDESNGTDPSADDDNDGVPNYLDDNPADPAIGDDNGMVEPNFDFDGDGIPNHFDLDSDNDGILDVLESGNGDLDTNNDGMIDSNDTGFADADNNGQADSSEGTTPVNTDGTGNPDYLDIDADDDGIPDNVEAQPTTGYVAPADAFDANGVDTNYPGGLVPEDTDGDGTPDYLDADSDDDGVDDVLEAGQGALTGTDSDNDGLDDGFDDTPGNDVNDDLDTGADGTDNEDDADLTEVDFRSVLDHDQDGIPDTVDLDDDNDGIADVDESKGTDPSADDDNDGVPNYLDDDPADPAIGDDNGMVEPDFDFDGDGIPNHFDLDSDNDGILDVLESGNGALDTNNDGMIDNNDTGFADADNNGQADSSEGTTPVNTDGTGNPDYLDIDADDDGIPDNVEVQPTTGYEAPDNTFDANGVDTNYPNGITPVDTDGDGTPDYLDADSDDDGYSDVVEAGQGSLTGTDSDNDGLDDGFDDTLGNDVNNDLDTGADGTDNDDDPTTPEVDFREMGDSDGDGVLDTQEEADGTDPNNPCDYVIEHVTLDFSGDYLVADCDGDGVTNGQELEDGTNPEDPCDYDEASISLEQGGDYLISDCDEDGLTTSQEEAIGTDPNNADTDGDTIPDGQELEDGTDPLNPCDSINGVPTLEAGCDPELVETGISVTNEIITPDNDGVNDYFEIDNIESFPNNKVQIYNRWGVLVYEMSGYDNGPASFRGVSNGRATIQVDSKLPVGVYFYVIKYENKGEYLSKAGYLYVNR
ncbi:hypothetical protein B4Q04_16705 [Zobellia sp. OII3]|uniref:T9SS type B sorting domain-containing protein n=1 Tax=Zobellia sp. OII3 TaxID=2034520 RepID=UPI000B529D0E|nr:gliding motility-associated C-terminal domain-containing protein [Zobellia sp. OII3]OWW24114.1 hypothetical protein B4Q04_16705 [Zobellia sp. OII3]